MKSVSDLEQEIRDFINSPREQQILLQHPAAWNMLCSCLDVIGDTELALETYHSAEAPKDDGGKYLLVYGVLQALFIQQDAVQNLCDALEIDYEPDPLLREIREIRSDSIGHPTKRGRGQGRAYNFISRPTLSKAGFDLMTTFPDQRMPIFRSINIPTMIERQTEKLREVLAEIVDKLRQEELEHREKFREDRLQDIFPQTLKYHIGKIYEAILGSKPVRLSTADMQIIRQIVEKFKEQLRERGTLEVYDSVTELINRLDYPLSELKAYLEDPQQSNLNDQSAYIFCFFIDKHLDELKEISEEIDEVYEAEP